MPESKSTDKLQIVMDGINNRVLSDDMLKQRVKKITINWDLYGDDADYVVVPNIDIEFKD